MSRLTSKFSELLEFNRTALIPYVTAGDPNPNFTVPIMHALVEAGSDVLELGVPFSDPMADGPVIQRASERALSHGVSLTDVLNMVREFRHQDRTTPVVLMGYLNPIECMGYEQFVNAAADADVDGVLTVDMPPEEAQPILKLLEDVGIDPIFLLAPNSDEERIKRISEVSKGYIYYVSLKGITGASHIALESIAEKLAMIKQITHLPVGVGFGIKNSETAAAIANHADAVVVGSALISQIESNLTQPEISKQKIIALIASMRRAMDG